MMETAQQPLEGLTEEDLEEETILELPGREMMSIISLSPLPVPTAAKAVPAVSSVGAEQITEIEQAQSPGA